MRGPTRVNKGIGIPYNDLVYSDRDQPHIDRDERGRSDKDPEAHPLEKWLDADRLKRFL